MTTILYLFGTYITFAIWQSTFWLAAALLCGKLYRRPPWKAHICYTTGIFAATLTPLLSTIVSAMNGGVLNVAVPKWFEPQTLGLICLIGTTFFALALLYGIAASRKLMFHTTPFPDKESQDALLRHSKTLRNVSLPILFTSPSVKSPTVWCWGLHPAVLLPESIAKELRHNERDAVFLHELSHIIRRDHLTALAVRLCGAVLFWNPLYWLVLWQSDLAADESCDHLVLTQGNIPPQQYTDTLLRLVAPEYRLNSFVQFLSRKEKIMKRIDRITNFVRPDNLAGTPVYLWTASVFTTALFLCVALAFCQEGKQATTNQAGEFTLETGVKGTVTMDGKPLAGATVTLTPREPAAAPPDVVISQEDVLIFDKGIWTNKNTGKELPSGTVVQGTDGTFRLDIKEGVGSVVKLTGTGSSGMGKYIEFSKGGNSVSASHLTRDKIDKILNAPIMGDEDVFVFGDGVWKNEKTGKELPAGTLVQGTRGVFRLDKKDEKGQVVLVEGYGAIGSGEYIRLTQGGNGFAGRNTPFPVSQESAPITTAVSPMGMTGVSLNMQDGYVVIKDVIKGSPAAASGEIHPQDRIAGIGQGKDGAILDVTGFQLADISQLMRGNRGSIVRLKVLPGGKEPSKIVELVRDSIPTTLPAPDGGFISPQGLTHLVICGPAGDFNPQTYQAYHDLCDAPIRNTGANKMFSKMQRVDGKNLLLMLTNDPVRMRGSIDALPQLEYLRTERLTQEMFEEHIKHWAHILGPADGGYVTPQGGYTHKAVFGPKDDFQPNNPMQLLNELNDPLFKTNIATGYFRTWPEDGRLIGGICTHDAEGLKKVIESAPRLEFIKSERLTKESFEAYEKTPQLSMPPADGGYAAPEGGFTHLLVYGPKGDFKPQGPRDFLNISHPKYTEFKVHNGYFRTRVENGKLIAYHLTTTPEEFKKLIESIPQFEYIKTERLTKEMFEAHEKTVQESLPLPPSPRLLEIEKTDWFGKLNERQKQYVRWDENQFAYVYGSEKYNVGDTRDEFEKRWLEELEKPEPGFPGMTVTPYVEAIIGLAKIKSDKALQPLLKIAVERVVKDNAHRHYATKALGMLGNPAAIPELIPLVYHFNFNTRWDAQISLVRLTGQSFGGDAKAWGEWYMVNQDKLGKNLPAFDTAPVDWSCGSTNSEIQRYCDPAVQEENDNRFFRGQSREDQGASGGGVPVIVKMEPANGAADVDAAVVKELRVTFDIDMNTGGYSWCGGGPMFPKLPDGEKPKWIDKRTCVLPVELESGKDYVLGINAPSFKNFRSEAGVPVVPVTYKFSTK
ncbi:MAG: PDZ domain-containing protein [Planctomycetaceae bacterium]|nr:PDZ domain-containing protein [Planctomycetaceae bacterium]